jgi:hypothetical protein
MLCPRGFSPPFRDMSGRLSRIQTSLLRRAGTRTACCRPGPYILSSRKAPRPAPNNFIPATTSARRCQQNPLCFVHDSSSCLGRGAVNPRVPDPSSSPSRCAPTAGSRERTWNITVGDREDERCLDSFSWPRAGEATNKSGNCTHRVVVCRVGSY